MDARNPLPTVTAAQKFALVSGTIVGAGGPMYSGKPVAIDKPFKSQVTENHSGIAQATLAPFIGECANASSGRFAMPADGPLRTQCAETKGGHFNVVTGTLVHVAHGEQDKNGKKRGRGARDLMEPAPTVLASPDGALAAASLVKLRGTNIGSGVDEPVHTVSAGGTHHAVVAASVIRHFGKSVGQGVDEPAPTVMAGGQGKTGTVAAYLAQHNGGFNDTPGHPADEPVSTLNSTGSQQQVVAASLASYFKSEQDGQAVTEPMRTATTKARQCHVESTAVLPMTPEQQAGALAVATFLRAHGVEFQGEYATVAGYVIVDIVMRMLTPRELFLAQGFPADYVIDKAWFIDPKTGNLQEVALTKEQQIRMCGNSVSPPVAEALVRANVPELAIRRDSPRPKRKPRPVLQPQ